MAKVEKRSALIGRLKSFIQERIIEDGVISVKKADEFFEEVGVSDRVTMLICCILIEDALRDLLNLHLPQGGPDLFSDRGLLSSIDSRCRLAYAMGLINETARDDLNAIRELRNAAAHASSSFSFEQPVIESVALLITATAKSGLTSVPLTENKKASQALIRCVASSFYYAIAFSSQKNGPFPITATSHTWPEKLERL